MGILSRVGLDRPELRAWAMYDWANSAFITVIITAVFPIYFQKVASTDVADTVATVRHGRATTIALICVALLSPILGAVADYAGIKKRMLGFFLGLGLGATACMFFIREGDWLLAATLFILGNIGVLLSLTFYDSLLPHIAGGSEMDRVSTGGYAVGYLGGGLLLAVNLLIIQQPQWFGIGDAGLATRICFLSVAVWWGVFSLPLMLRVPEPARRLEADERGDEDPVVVAFRRLAETLRELRGYRQAFLLLVAMLIYNDGITTIYRMATIYGAEIGLPQTDLITAILLVQFVGVPFAFLFGVLSGRIGTKRAILLGLGVYLGISIFGYFLQTALHFYLLALAVAMVQGGTQALSRSLFASMIPRHRSSQFFGFYAVSERLSAFLGPLVFAEVTSFAGSSRYAVLSVIAFFLVGGGLLTRVRVEEGQQVARAAALRLHGPPEP